RKDDAASLLNKRGAQYIGREYTLDTPVENGYGKLKIGDSLWTINGENLPAGTTIIITAAEDNHLHYRKK
ncbi:MAG: NfeD family protein, partial [Cardiobacterium sp.]